MKYARYIMLALFFLGSFLLFTYSIDSINQDIGRHIQSGKIIWQNKAVYHTNLFSFTEPNHPFINHHWLSEVVFYGFDNLFGLKSLIILKASLLTLTLYLLWLTVKRLKDDVIFLITMGLSLPLFFTRTDIRPEMFSYLFFALILLILSRIKYADNWRWLWAIPVIQVAWVNMHIYFPMGLGLVGAFLIDTAFQHGVRSDKTKRIAIVLVATTLACAINPNFISGALEPFRILGSYGYSIVENQNIFFLKDYGVMLGSITWFQLSLIIAIIAYLYSVTKGSARKTIFETIVLLACAILAIKMIRNFALYAMALSVALPIYLSHTGVRIGNAKNKLMLATIGILAIAIANIPIGKISSLIGNAKNFGLGIPDGANNALKFISDNNIHGLVFNNFDVGSFLIWKLYPTERVFVDGRPEAYSPDFFQKTYIPMQEDPEKWIEQSDKYNINYVFFDYHDITPWAQSFLNSMVSNPNWPMVYLDDSVVIFIKDSPSNKAIIGEFRIKPKLTTQ